MQNHSTVQNQLLMLAGVAGMCAGVSGLFLSPELQRWFFLGGAVLMMIPALVHGERIFVALQGVVLVAILASFLSVDPWVKGMIPLTVFFMAIVFLTSTKRLVKPQDWFGAGSLFILSLGYALQHYVLFMMAGGLLSLFSALEIRRGFKAAWLWLILNVAFTLSSIINY